MGESIGSSVGFSRMLRMETSNILSIFQAFDPIKYPIRQNIKDQYLGFCIERKAPPRLAEKTATDEREKSGIILLAKLEIVCYRYRYR